MTSPPPLERQVVASSDLPFVALAIVSGVILVYLGRSLTFWWDEWSFVTFSGSAIDYLRPYNGHWSTLPLILYRVTFDAIGLESYLPYLAEVIVLHLLAVAGAYVLMRQRLGPVPATSLALPLLLLGSGSENLFWAFQTGFVGSTMLGIWALVFIERTERWSPVVALALALATVMSSGMGLVFLVAIWGRTLFDPALRRRAIVAAATALVYVAWYVLLGRGGAERDLAGTEQDLASLAETALFVVRGSAYATGGITGLDFSPESRFIALGLFVLLAYATVRAIVAGRSRPLAAGCVLGVATLYAVVGIARAELPSEYASRSRFVYCASFLLVLSFADWIPSLWKRASVRSAPRRSAAVLFVLLVAVSTASNIDALGSNRAEAQQHADLTRAYVALATAHRGDPWVDNDGFAAAPPVAVLLETIEAHGSPLEDALLPAVVKPPGPEMVERALLQLVGRGFRVEPARKEGVQWPAPIVDAEHTSLLRDRGCTKVRATGQGAMLTLLAPSAGRIRLTSMSAISAVAYLSRDWPSSRYVRVDLMPNIARDVVVPDVGDGRSWRIRLDLSGATAGVSVCSIGHE